METKICRNCNKEKKLSEFRTRPTGFTLNQCRQCENEMNKQRRLLKQKPQMFNVKTKSGKSVKASLKPIKGGRITTSPKTKKVLYFDGTVNRDNARVAFSAFANIPRTGISYQKV